MKDAQKPDHISLNTLITRLKEGRFVIPDFQREFEWRPWDIRDLMRSIFLDYYIGSLLLWKGKKENFQALSCEIVYGYKNTTGQHPWDYGNGSPDYIVLDGQQRLTALYYAFIAPDVPLPNRASRAVYFIHVDKFMNEQYDEAFQYDWLSKRFNKILNNPVVQYAEHIFPLSIIGADGWDLFKWVQGYENFWQTAAVNAQSTGETGKAERAASHAQNAKAFGKHLKGITGEYQIAYIELDKDLEVDKVCDIFTQINSRGIRLDVFDLINALLKPKGLQLKHMWREASPRLEFVDTEKMNVHILQVMSILRQSYCSPKYLYYLLPGQEKQVRDPDGTRRKEILVPDTADFKKRWNYAVNAIECAIKLLRHPQEFGAISSQYLPYVSILPVFAALQAHSSTLPANQRLDAQRKIRHWYWASVFLNRYSGAVESTSARDFLDVKAWLEGDTAEPALLKEFKDRFKNLDLRKETKRGTSVYNGIFNLLVLQGARDWMTGNVPQHDDLDDHHIVPASWVGSKNLKNNSIHTILNRTPLSADTNRNVINDRLPHTYLPELIANNGDTAVCTILQSHFISPAALEILMRDPFTPDDFDAFIFDRQRTIQEAIENLLIKERLDLSPRLRELDESIEQIEISLRQIIVKTFDGNTAHFPPHIIQKVNERIERAAKKNAVMDIDKYQTISGMLEFFDLRELQDTIMSKAAWDHFSSRFTNKEALLTKFGQLSELRNGIRHSRTVDDIIRKEGEAAILWFNMTKHISQSELESYLWGAATLLRGYIDAGDYKQFIFPLLFYKRLCDVYDEELAGALEESGGDNNYAQMPEQHRFQIPIVAHWKETRNQVTNVGKVIQNALRAIEKANPDTLYAVFGDAQWTNKDRLPDHMLRELIEHFSSQTLSLSNCPEDELGVGYEFLIKKFADDSGHTAAEFYTNRTVVHLMTEMLEPKPGESIYDPTCGSAGMLLSAVAHLKRHHKEWRTLKLYGQERNLLTSAIGRMNLFLHGIEDFRVVRGNTLANPVFVEGDKLMQFDVVLANPPYSIKQWDRGAWAADLWGRNIYGTPPQGRADYAFWQHIITSMKTQSGRCAILFPHGVLFRNEEREMREKLIAHDVVE